jgi:hypothetical protein
MRYPWRLIVVIPGNIKAITQGRLETIVRKADVFPSELVPLGVTVNGPPTHYGTQLVLNARMKEAFDNSINDFASVFWFLLDNNTGGLIEVGVQASGRGAILGEILDFGHVLELLGLIVKR